MMRLESTDAFLLALGMLYRLRGPEPASDPEPAPTAPARVAIRPRRQFVYWRDAYAINCFSSPSGTASEKP